MSHDPNEIVYSINVSDLQKVASRIPERQLTNREIEVVGDAVGDFIDWYQAIANAIEIRLESAARLS